MAILKSLLTEKLRPETMEDLILLPRIRKSIGNSKELNQHILMVSPPGMGKTSFAKILAQGHPLKYINVSADRGIDTVKDEIIEFCNTKSIDVESTSSLKIVVLDEVDGATEMFFKAMRATMEKYASNVRFIATCNYIQKIPDPILSRFLVLNFNPETKEEEQELFKLYRTRVKKVSDMLKLKWDSVDTLNEFLKRYFPDLRKIFSKLQDLHSSGNKDITIDLIKNSSYSYKELFDIIPKKANSYDNYKLIIKDYSGKEDEVISAIGSEVADWLKDKYPTKIEKLPAMLISCAQWEYQKYFMIDKNLALLALVYNLQTIFNN